MLKQFSEYLRKQGKSSRTATAYCRDAGLYLRWCQETFGEQPTQLYRANVLEYISYMRNIKGYSPNPDSTVTSVPQVDFKSLLAVNPEIVAWLTLDGTNINYPVTQHNDNDYYLHHLFNGEYNSSGCLFLDCRNPSDFSGRHTMYIWPPYG